MKIINCEQGGETWFRARAGKVTASEVIDAIAVRKINPNKGGSTAAREAYKAKLVAEILTGEPDLEGYLSQCMKDGTEYEAEAREAYSVKADVLVSQVGFIVHPTIERAGASPDGIIKPNGGLEIKAPKTKTHIGYMLAGMLPEEYEPQVMWNIACAEADWWDFASYGFRMPFRHQLFIKRVYRNDERIAEIEDGVRLFLQECDDMIGALERINPEITSVPCKEPKPLPLDNHGDVDQSALADELFGEATP